MIFRAARRATELGGRRNRVRRYGSNWGILPNLFANNEKAECIFSAFCVNSNLCALALENHPAPRGSLNSNTGFVELGSFRVNKLRRIPLIEMFPWGVPETPKPKEAPSPRPERDPHKLARYYQSLLDSGQFENRAALARFLGVSRARVTQVLKRLNPKSLAEDVV